MSTQGAFTIILNENKDRILLVKRRDFPLWDLPGGSVEVGEDSTDCAIREAIEETGYKVHIYKKIGGYHRPKINDIQHIFLGKVIGGQAIISGDETSKLKWFKLNSLPLLMVPHRKTQIKDYLKGGFNLVKILNDSVVFMKIKRILLKKH